MAKRITIGSVLKNKNSTKEKPLPDYIKVNTDIVLKKGDILNLESKQTRRESLEYSVANGLLSGDYVEKLREEIENMPEFVRFNIVKKNVE